MDLQPKKQNHVRRRLIYLLTCWMDRDDETQNEYWRFKLEMPGPNQRRIFKTLGEVLETIEKELK